MTRSRAFDVVVLGGGIVGACAALAAARDPLQKAVSVALVDAHSPGHRHGSSHGDGRMVRSTYPESAYLEMIDKALTAWAEIEQLGGVRLLEVTGSWECGLPDAPAIQELDRGLSTAGVLFEKLDAEESRRRFPQLDVPDTHVIIHQPEGRIIRADLAVETVWRLAEKAGVAIFQGRRVETIETLPSGRIRLLGQDSDLETQALVVAAGGWSPALLQDLGLTLPLDVSRETLAYFPIRQSAPDHSFSALPTVLDYDGDDIFYALPQIETPGVKAGLHHAGREATPEAGGSPDPQILQRICEFVERRFPYLDPRPSTALACLYTNTPDYHFVIDRHPHLPQVAIGTGFSGHGFKFAPVLGRALARLATGGESLVSPELFGMGRFNRPALSRRTCA